jgi:hypothetical protein
MEQRIVEAVGLGYRPGPVSIKKGIVRAAMRGFVWLLHRNMIPLEWRQRAMFGALSLRSKFLGVPFLAGASIGDTFENDLMKLIFQATAIANVADNAGTSPLTNLSVALHTADPGETGTQSTSEITYTSYARVSVARTSGGWTVTANSVSPVASISFPAGTGGSGTATHFSVGPTGGGTTKIFFSGTVTPNIVTGNGITPVLTTATAITID